MGCIFCILNPKITHNFQMACAIFALLFCIKFGLHLGIAHRIGQNRTLNRTELRDFAHYNIF